MAKQKNPNIGMVPCSMCGDPAAVRKTQGAKPKFYYDCLRHGRITPNLAEGQDWILEKATIWGEKAAPVGVPVWIAEQWPWVRALHDPAGRTPYNGQVAPAPASEEVPEKAPLQQGRPVITEKPPKLPPAPPVPVVPVPVTEQPRKRASGFGFFEESE